MNRSLAHLITAELFFELLEERSGCGKQGIVLLEAREIQQWLSMQFVSGHAIPDDLDRRRNGPPDRGAHLLELGP